MNQPPQIDYGPDPAAEDKSYDAARQEEVDNPPVRFSHLRAYGRSAMHGHHARTQPEQEPTAAMQLGSAVHALVLGNKPVVAYPGAVRRGKEWEAFAAAHGDDAARQQR